MRNQLVNRLQLLCYIFQPHMVECIISEDITPCSHLGMADHGHQTVNALLNVNFDHSWPSVESARTAIKEQLPEDFPVSITGYAQERFCNPKYIP